MGQNFSSLEYGNCRDFAPVPMQCLVKVNLKSIPRKKNQVLLIEEFQFLVLVRDMIMLQHLTVHLLLYFLSSGLLGKVKGERMASSYILLWSLKLKKQLTCRFEVKNKKSKFFLSKVTKRVQNPWSFFEFEHPPFWTAFLPVSSIKGMLTAIL